MESAFADPGSSAKPCKTGTRSSAARLSATMAIRGRAEAFCSRTRSRALAVGVSPETLIRPVPSLIWEATPEKAGNFSTSAKSSRTNGRAIALSFYQRALVPRFKGFPARRALGWSLPSVLILDRRKTEIRLLRLFFLRIIYEDRLFLALCTDSLQFPRRANPAKTIKAREF